MTVSLRASSPIWASEASLARTRERAAKPRGAVLRLAVLRLGEVQMKICTGWLEALLSPAPRGFAARSRVLSRLASFAQIGELARRLYDRQK